MLHVLQLYFSMQFLWLVEGHLSCTTYPPSPKLMLENCAVFLKNHLIINTESGGKGELSSCPNSFVWECGWRKAARVKCLAQEHNTSTPPGPGLEPGGHCTSHKVMLHISSCYIAGVFPATARPFIGLFIVT